MYVKNNSDNAVTVTPVRKAFGTGNWDSHNEVLQAWKSDGSFEPITLAGKTGAWLCDNACRYSTSAKDMMAFNGIVRLRTTGTVTVYCIAYRLGKKPDDKTIEALDKYPYDKDHSVDIKVCTGIGTGYLFNTSIDLNIGGGAGHNLSANPVFYCVADTEGTNNRTDLTPIQTVNGLKTTDLGNWTCEYNFAVNIHNNSGKAQMVYGFTSTNTGRPCIYSNGHTPAGKALGLKDWGEAVDRPTWRWFAELVQPGTTTYEFTICNGSYGNGALTNAFSLLNTIV